MTPKYPTYKLGPEFRSKLSRFVDNVMATGFDEFAKEFKNIDEFVAKAAADDAERDDKRLRSTPKEKYLLEAIAFKIYDELNREAFNKAGRTLIVLPDCLSLHNPDCEKTDLPYGDVCQQCTESCQAYHVVKLGEQYDIPVVFSKRKLEQQIEHYAETEGDLGVVGIACLTMLASGMRTASEVGVPTRGVLLSFTGCEHWNEEAFASGFPISWLKEILKEKYGADYPKTDNR